MLGDGLLAVIGERHRKQRRLLNPVFSIAHMREMTPIFYSIARKLQEAVAARVQGGQTEIDMLDWMGRTALELIGQGGLGYSFDPLTSESREEFTEAIKSFMYVLLHPFPPTCG